MSKTIIQKLAEIESKFRLEYDAQLPSNKGGGEYWTERALTERGLELLREHKVYLAPVKVTNYQNSFHFVQEGASSKYRPSAAISVEWKLHNLEEPFDVFSTETAGSGSDMGGDSSVTKAWTQARRILWLHLFGVTENEKLDPDLTESREKDSPEYKAPEKPDAESTEFYKIEIGKLVKGNKELSDLSVAWGSKLSDGKPRSEWTKDATVLKGVYEKVKSGEAVE